MCAFVFYMCMGEKWRACVRMCMGVCMLHACVGLYRCGEYFGLEQRLSQLNVLPSGFFRIVC